MKNGYKIEDGKVLIYQWSGEKGQTFHDLSADPQTFQEIEVSKMYAEDVYSRDKDSIFIRDKKFVEADLATFEVVGYGYSKDKNANYHERK